VGNPTFNWWLKNQRPQGQEEEMNKMENNQGYPTSHVMVEEEKAK
jgi:hypothetical protein